jgi:hypothetical protein
MFRLKLLVVPGMLAVMAACRTAAPPPDPPDQSCVFQPGRYNFVEYSAQVFRQGAVVRIQAMRDNMPFGSLAIPMQCTSGWAVSGPAELSADRTILTIRPDAPPGSQIQLSFNVRGEAVVSRLTVVGRDQVVLIGTWGQSAAAGCEGLEPVRELQFGAERFSVTFTPFETYKDYWGTYRFDPATGALHMNVEGGNSIPGGLDLDGVARIEEGHLVLEQMFLGDRRGQRPAAGCLYKF